MIGLIVNGGWGIEMKTIHKYIVHPSVDGHQVMLPLGARPIHVGLQSDVLMLWAEVDSERECNVPYRVWVIGTGFNLPKEATVYLGTIRPGELVFHVYAERICA